MSTATPEESVSLVMRSVTEAISEWQRDNPPDQLKIKAQIELNKLSQQILFGLLGFEKSTWDNKLKLDHCNGRAGESAAGDYLRKNQQAAIEEWLKQCKLPKFPKYLQEEMEKEALKMYQDAFRTRIKTLIQFEAQKDADEAFKALSAAGALRRYEQTMNLINPEG